MFDIEKILIGSLVVNAVLFCWVILATVMWSVWKVAYEEANGKYREVGDYMQRHREAYGTMNYYKGLNEATEKFLEEEDET